MAAGPQRMVEIGGENTAEFVIRNMRREETETLCSERVEYYGGATARVPFQWETTPGTPKCAEVCNSSPPPPILLPPPSQLLDTDHLEVCPKKNRRLLSSIFRAFSGSGKNQGVPSSPSTSSSSSNSSSNSSLSYSDAIGDIIRRSRSLHRSEWSSTGEGGRKWTESVVLRSKSSSKGMKKALYSLVGHASTNAKQ